jgi:hypothetical protein
MAPKIKLQRKQTLLNVLAKSSTSVNEPRPSSDKGMFDQHEQLICVAWQKEYIAGRHEAK